MGGIEENQMDKKYLILFKLSIIYTHMILRDAHEAGLISDDMWVQLLKDQMNSMMEVDDGKSAERSMV